MLTRIDKRWVGWELLKTRWEPEGEKGRLATIIYTGGVNGIPHHDSLMQAALSAVLCVCLSPDG